MSASSEKALWKVMSWSNGATTGDRTSTKPLPLISDPLNSLLMPHHNQDTIRPMSPAESNLQTRSDIIPGRHTDASPTSVSHPHSGTTTSTVNESNTRSYMPQPPPLLGLSPDRPPPPSASHITTSIEPHYSAGSGKPFRNLPPPISGSGLGDGTRMGPTSNSYNPRLQSTSTSVSVVPDSEPRVPTPSTDTPTTQSMHREADEDHNSRAGSLKQPSSPDHDYSSSKPGNAEDMLLRFFNALGQHLSEGATGSSSSPSSPSPPPTQPQAPATPRRPGFDRRLQAQRDFELKPESRLFSWLEGASYTGIMAQNNDGKCGLVDPESTFSEGIFSSSQPYLKYLD
ncbi:hypothetical protein BD410DRAFT_902635 [Rickenella mellea]|uniref:Uncharacterized protein n=1 Tax=Rickenella mellea TaxID=50990 RepID=A0A4Y7PIM3_9AGAM|nr:hypothetical protein BD410DRAFT_902635 [Rickenella mellea]